MSTNKGKQMIKKSTMARLAAAGAVVAGFATFGLAPSAHAADNQPCTKQYHHDGTIVQKCNLWTGNVPVWQSNRTHYKRIGFGPSVPVPNPTVGRLVYGGSTNWFECQLKGSEYTSPQGYTNDWWALTEADNGRWGWVPEVYFSGGNTNEPDAGLRHCG